MDGDIVIGALRISAIVAVIDAVAGSEPPIGVKPGLQRHFSLAALVRRGQRFIAVFGPFERPPEQQRRADHCAFFLPWRILQPERATDVFRNHPDRGLRLTQGQAEPARNVMRALAGDIERQLFRTFAGGDHRAVFHRRLRDALMHDCLRDAVRGCGERGFQILVDLFLADRRGEVAIDPRVDRVRRLGVGDRHHRRQLFIIDHDQRRRIFGNRAAVSDNQRHRIADIAHGVGGERGDRRFRRRKEEAHHRDRLPRQIFGGVDRVHALERARRRCVDRQDLAVRDRAADKGDMEHAGQHDIVGELAATGQQPRVFLARRGFADPARRARACDYACFTHLHSPRSVRVGRWPCYALMRADMSSRLMKHRVSLNCKYDGQRANANPWLAGVSARTTA